MLNNLPEMRPLDPVWWRWRIIDRINRPIMNRFRPPGDSVLDRDWDNLIVLDACRADVFEEVFDIPQFDSYDRITSVETQTPDWLKTTFGDREFPEIVYVSASPHPSDIVPSSFAKLEDVWKEGFDESIGTVSPDVMVKETIEAVEEYPNKRIIAHFMQPHHPFIAGDLEYDRAPRGDGRHPWEALNYGLLEEDEVWTAYKANLELVRDKILNLVAELPGRTVITSDHGNAIGERSWPIPIRIYGHPGKIPIDILLSVPWAVIDGERREITAADSLSRSTATDDEIKDRLRQLGYR